MSVEEELSALEGSEKKMMSAPWEPCGAKRDTNNGIGCACGLIWSLSSDVSVGITHKPQDDEKIDTEVNDNTRGICIARNALPKLIAEVRLLRRALGEPISHPELLRPDRRLGEQ